MEKSKIMIINNEIVDTVMGAVLGFVASILGGWIVYRREKKNQESFAASLLYNDLKSIEKYLADERSSVNIRYSEDWQCIVAQCPFFNAEEIELIYYIYGEVYNYNYHYRCKEQLKVVFSKEEICSYTKLQNLMFDTTNGYIHMNEYSKEYDSIIKNLQRRKPESRSEDLPLRWTGCSWLPQSLPAPVLWMFRWHVRWFQEPVPLQ